MVNYFSSSFTLGILGGGQLGKMLLYETRKFDIKTRVLDPSAEAPCRIACDVFQQGDLMDFDTVYNFGKKVDLLTFEIEGVNVDALEKLEAEGKKVYPSAKTLRNIQDKGVQKQFYKNHQIRESETLCKVGVGSNPKIPTKTSTFRKLEMMKNVVQSGGPNNFFSKTL